jgi:hypothetical protein
MAEKTFTEKQREIVARKMGYDGPMNMFDKYLDSSPADAQMYGKVVSKFMARGGSVTKGSPLELVTGGDVTRLYQQYLGRAPEDAGTAFWTASKGTDAEIEAGIKDSPEAKAYAAKLAADAAKVKADAAAKLVDPTTNTPIQPTASTVTAAQITPTQDQTVNTQLAPTQATSVTAAAAPTTSTTVAPEVKQAERITASSSIPGVAQVLSGTQAAQGTVSEEAMVNAAQANPLTSAIQQVQAAQGTTTTVEGAPTRTLGANELVSGTSVDQAQVNATLAQNTAAQGQVTSEMTVQGQLNTLLQDFDSGNPPSWAAASMRNATAILAARGIGSSSLAGQAIIQATLEAATPIAAQDAQVFQQMGLQNLSNRQQTAILTAQQRAQFLGQEFDQAFQTKVVNASRVADVANMNFSAQQQIALENARMAQTMDLANLSNSQALVMANAAQIANLETANLNNRQQSAVVNAQSFLQMDMTNLANLQQTELFKSQSMVQSVLSDTAAQNAAKQFNATGQMQTDQFFSNLVTQVGQFNSTQTNAMSQFNTQQFNAVAQFNAETQNQRDQFNAQNRLVIDQSNAQWRRDISTANTAATNRANEFNATKAQEISMVEYNNLWQQVRDEIEYSFKASESTKEQANAIARQEIASNATILAATIAKDAKIAETIGTSAATILSGTTLGKSAIDALSKYGGDALSGIKTWVGSFFTPSVDNITTDQWTTGNF